MVPVVHAKSGRACFKEQLMRPEARSVDVVFRVRQSAPLERGLVLGSRREEIIDQMKGRWREASRLPG